MGQAKKRGTFDQRKAFALSKNHERMKQSMLNTVEVEKNMTDDELAEAFKARLILATALSRVPKSRQEKILNGITL